MDSQRSFHYHHSRRRRHHRHHHYHHQLSVYLAENNLFPKLQSGFRRFHSTESAVLRVLSDIYSVVDRGDVALLTLLDVSAAFDTVDHSISLERLSTSFGLGGQAYSSFDSYISGQFQYVRFIT